MYAALVTVTIDAGEDDKAREMLDNQVVPMVKSAAGHIAGYWTEPRDGKAFSIVVFDTEEHVRAAAPTAGSRPPGSPVTIDSVEILEVVASS